MLLGSSSCSLSYLSTIRSVHLGQCVFDILNSDTEQNISLSNIYIFFSNTDWLMFNSTAEICGPPALESLHVQGAATRLNMINMIEHSYSLSFSALFPHLKSLSPCIFTARLSTPSSTTCLPSSSPCRRPTDWPASETMWCFSFTSTRDGTQPRTPTWSYMKHNQWFFWAKTFLPSSSPGSIRWTKQGSTNTEFPMTRSPKGSRTRTKKQRRVFRLQDSVFLLCPLAST